MSSRSTAPVRLVSGAAEHILPLARRLRAIDRIECEAMGLTAEQALHRGVATSAQVWTAMIGDEPHAMFGVVVEATATGDAVPWFLGSDVVRRHGRSLIVMGPTILTAMHRHGSRLRNFVSCDNRQAIRLLKHWGFTVEHERVVVRSVAFRRFIRENN